MVKNAKILSIKNGDGSETMGVFSAKGVIDIRAVAKKLNIAAPYTLDQLLQEGNVTAFNKVVAGAEKSGVPYLAESKIRYGRLFKSPGKIICVGINYRQYAEEVGVPKSAVPALFNKYDNSLAAHQCVLEIPPPEVSYKLDYETELLVVIGKRGRNIPESEALNYVAGYCTANDFTSRDLQLDLPGGQWMMGKTLDQYAPIGPNFVTADIVGDPNNLQIQTLVNGEIRQNSNTSDFIHNVQKLLAYISTYWALEPGDIIFTGTPQGVIANMPKDQQVWLKKGDVVTSVVEKLGELKFTLG
ncbi:5-oxopent-3-ene-1,2,5-tricarboxylate decarboxylase [Polynucleobacter campilacus]|uniref:5-oxopent-3-ene-1,2,5-tricarboxylate decarboxylase n=2 Tax=Polynucleobacter campilacus TaxID=1743163 RepID=A0A254Q6G6_9BURK|nr:5-oxopent-3-ene-1,2,5-tricarboxylate decarboxylase [Polynucleobacter campilacus]